jgi:hypothetical protein
VIPVCPECDSAAIYQRTGRNVPAEVAYHCEDCYADFDEPARRERFVQPRLGSDSLAQRLDRMDPDDLGGAA